MKKHINKVVVLFTVIACVGLVLLASRIAFADPASQDITNQIIAREKASVEAWKRKDKVFFAEYLADDATYFGPTNPYLETDPKENFLPNFERLAEMIKFNDFQMYNPRVQAYGDAAVLTYNSSVSATMGGQPVNYTGKMTSVYVKKGGIWRVAHGHESMNPQAK